jgi:hypothetical protein
LMAESEPARRSPWGQRGRIEASGASPNEGEGRSRLGAGRLYGGGARGVSTPAPCRPSRGSGKGIDVMTAEPQASDSSLLLPRHAAPPHPTSHPTCPTTFPPQPRHSPAQRTLGLFLAPLIPCQIPPPIAPIENAPPKSLRMTQGLGSASTGEGRVRDGVRTMGRGCGRRGTWWEGVAGLGWGV